MQGLEKILEEMKEIKDGNRKEKLYEKYPPDSKEQECLTHMRKDMKMEQIIFTI